MTYLNKIRRWLKDELSKIEDEKFITQHVDYFGVPTKIAPLDIISQSLIILKESLICLRKTNYLSQVYPFLVFTLKCSNSMRMELGDLSDEIDDFTPPEIYIVFHQSARENLETEAYRIPCDVKELHEVLDENIYTAYYKCWRSELGAKNNWEYSRAVYVDIKDSVLKDPNHEFFSH